MRIAEETWAEPDPGIEDACNTPSLKLFIRLERIWIGLSNICRKIKELIVGINHPETGCICGNRRAKRTHSLQLFCKHSRRVMQVEVKVNSVEASHRYECIVRTDKNESSKRWMVRNSPALKRSSRSRSCPGVIGLVIIE